jgi:predicted nucleotidyltransferase
MQSAKGTTLPEPHLSLPADLVIEFCRRHHVRRLSLFGSVLRNDFRPDSDVDVLVEFEPGRVIGLRIALMEQELAQMLNGRTVDLRTPNELSPYFRDEVMREARAIHGAP